MSELSTGDIRKLKNALQTLDNSPELVCFESRSTSRPRATCRHLINSPSEDATVRRPIATRGMTRQEGATLIHGSDVSQPLVSSTYEFSFNRTLLAGYDARFAQRVPSSTDGAVDLDEIEGNAASRETQLILLRD